MKTHRSARRRRRRSRVTVPTDDGCCLYISPTVVRKRSILSHRSSSTNILTMVSVLHLKPQYNLNNHLHTLHRFSAIIPRIINSAVIIYNSYTIFRNNYYRCCWSVAPHRWVTTHTLDECWNLEVEWCTIQWVINNNRIYWIIINSQ